MVSELCTRRAPQASITGNGHLILSDNGRLRDGDLENGDVILSDKGSPKRFESLFS